MDRKYWVGLSLIPGIGSVLVKRLLDHFGSPEKVWQANKAELCHIHSIGEKTAASIIKTRDELDLDKFLYQCRTAEINIVTQNDPDFPFNLKEIYDPPPVIYYRGELRKEDFQSIAIVGSRKMTTYGGRITRKLARELVEAGFTVVSGMALGVDGMAHQAALDAGGRTIAVLGSGVDYIYPKEHTDLYQRIITSGAVISTFPPTTLPEKSHFPARNRIISGLSLGTVVVEANTRSGSLITADQALEQNREVFAVPGSVFSPLSRGTNNLIQKGARLITSVQDIISELNGYIYETDAPQTLTSQTGCQYQLNMLQSKILSLLERGEMSGDELVEELGLDMAEVNTQLFHLELLGAIIQAPGQKFAIK